jgi:uncharacterized membrane protein YhhN
MFAVISMFVSIIFSLCYQSGMRFSFFGDNAYTAGKLIASLVFVVTGIIALILVKKRRAYSWLVFAGLVSGCAGDLLLALSVGGPQSLFAAGMAAFLVGHALYTAAFFTVDGFRWRDVWITALFFAAMLAFSLLLKADYGSLAIPVYVYMLTLSALAGKAVSLFASHKMEPLCAFLMLAGALLWAFSDVTLCMNSFMKVAQSIHSLFPSVTFASSPSVSIDAYNSFSYFVGQTFMACTIFYYKQQNNIDNR